MFSIGHYMSGLSDRIAGRVARTVAEQLNRTVGRATNQPGGVVSQWSLAGPAPGRASAPAPSRLLTQAVNWFHNRQFSQPPSGGLLGRIQGGMAGMRYRAAQRHLVTARQRLQSQPKRGQAGYSRYTRGLAVRGVQRARQFLGSASAGLTHHRASIAAGKSAWQSTIDAMMQRGGGAKGRPATVPMPDVSKMTPQQIVTAMQQRSQQNQGALANWMSGRSGMFATGQRAYGLLMRRAQKYQEAVDPNSAEAKRVDVTRRILERRQQQLASAPKAGQTGYDATQDQRLRNRVAKAEKWVAQSESAQGGKVNLALNNLTKASAVYAQATNVAAGAMRVLSIGARAVGKYVVGPVAGLVGGVMAADGFASRQMERSRPYADYSARMSGVFTDRARFEAEQNAEFAQGTVDSTEQLSEARKNLQKKLQPLMIFGRNVMNGVATNAANMASGVLDRGGHFAEQAVNVTDQASKWNVGGTAMAGFNAVAAFGRMFDVPGVEDKFVKNVLGGGANVGLNPIKDAAAEDLIRRFGSGKAKKAEDEIITTDNPFSATLGAWSNIVGQKQDARENNKPKAPIPPVK